MKVRTPVDGVIMTVVTQIAEGISKSACLGSEVDGFVRQPFLSV